jgi:uncharacterized delta-60 repeat protein
MLVVGLWTAGYDGPAHGEDRCTGLVRDRTGSIFLTGYSFGDSSDFDFATVRFSPNGDTLWSRRYGSPLNCEDRAWCLTLDASDCLVVSGGSIADRSRGWDFQTIKYLPNGDTAWLRRTDFAFHYDDKPAALGVLPDNTIVVAGASRRRSSELQPRSDWDMALVRYTPQGDTVWTRLWDGPGQGDDYAASLAIARSGSIYLLGRGVITPPGPDIVLLKYRPDGTLVWHRAIDGAGRATDLASQVLLDSAGRCFVVGSVTGDHTSFDYLVACFDTTGRLLWQQSYDAARSVDICQAACLDREGNIIVTGHSTGTGSSFDVATLKYLSSGRLLWVRRYNGPANSADRGWCLASDEAGNVAVGASSAGAGSFPDLLLLGYSNDGDTLWSWRGPSAVSGETRPVAVTWEGDRLLVAGSDHNPATSFDYRLMLLDPTAGRR